MTVAKPTTIADLFANFDPRLTRIDAAMAELKARGYDQPALIKALTETGIKIVGVSGSDAPPAPLPMDDEPKSTLPAMTPPVRADGDWGARFHAANWHQGEGYHVYASRYDHVQVQLDGDVDLILSNVGEGFVSCNSNPGLTKNATYAADVIMPPPTSGAVYAPLWAGDFADRAEFSWGSKDEAGIEFSKDGGNIYVKRRGTDIFNQKVPMLKDYGGKRFLFGMSYRLGGADPFVEFTAAAIDKAGKVGPTVNLGKITSAQGQMPDQPLCMYSSVWAAKSLDSWTGPWVAPATPLVMRIKGLTAANF